MHKLLRLGAILGALFNSGHALAQSFGGELRAGSFWGNPSASAAPATDATATQMFDRNFGSTNGTVIKRQNGSWAGVPGVTVNVMEAPYSATCNGSANDTTAFNAALVAANAAGGGTVTAPDGKVCIIQTGTSVTMQSNTCIKGNFTLRGTSATNNTEMIVATDKVNICVEDVTIDMIDSFVAGNNNNAAMSFQGTSLSALTVRVKNVKVINQGNFGLLINGGTFWALDNRFTMDSPYGVVAGVGQQTHAIQTAANFQSTGIIDGNVASGSSINVSSQKTQITNNRVSIWGYGSGIGHGGLSLPCDIKDAVGALSCSSIIAFNVIEGGLGIDANTFVNAGIESYDPQNIVVGNRISNVAGTGIIGGASSIASNFISDICNYYATATISGGCYGIFLRNDGAAGDVGSYTSMASNKVFASFGAPMAVTGTTNSAGVIRITVASTATIGATDTSVPCRVKDVGGTTNANKGWAACVVKSATSIELTGSVFNSAWTSGGTIGPMMDYAYGENSASMPGIKMVGNTFRSGLTGTHDILNTGTTSASPPCAAPCIPSDGNIMVGLGGANQVWVARNLSGDVASVSSAGAVTLATVNAGVGTFGSATQAPQITVNAKGLITAASANTITPAVGSITGLGTGVATALGVNVGTAGAFVVNGGALGSPSSVGTMPAHTLGGAISGGGNQINNVHIGASSPLTGSFTTVTASTTTTPLAVSASTTGALTQIATFLNPSMSNGNKVMLVIGTAASSNNAFYQYYNHDSTDSLRYWGVQAYEDGAGTGLNVFADSAVTVGAATSCGTAGCFAASSFVKTGVTTVGSLPTCNATRQGGRLMVTDSNAASYTAGIGAVVAAGGATVVPVTCDGTNWRIGANDNAKLRNVG